MYSSRAKQHHYTLSIADRDPLHEASLATNILSSAQKNSLAYIQKKLAAGQLRPECVNVYDKNGNSALYYACRNGSAEMARILLQNGADPNARNEGGNTALHAAFRTGNPGVFLAFV